MGSLGREGREGCRGGRGEDGRERGDYKGGPDCWFSG